jgi:hypothetical protein
MLKDLWQKIVTLMVAGLIWLLTARASKANPERMQRLDFKDSTQKMGVRFTEQLRDAWRRRWFKIRHD